MELYEYDSLCDRFGEENVCCRNCENWRPVVYGDALPQTFGLCMMKCFEIDAPGDPVVLLKQGSNCFTPDAVRQRFVPVNELIMRERMAESYKATLRRLDADLRREAAAWEPPCASTQPNAPTRPHVAPGHCSVRSLRTSNTAMWGRSPAPKEN